MPGIMNTIRERAGGVLVGVLVVAFGGLWALQDSGAFDNVGQGRDTRIIGEVDGEPIGGELYQNAISQQTDAYTAQGATVNAALQRQIEDSVFDQLVDATLVEREMDRLGVEVTDEEVYELITGPNPDPLITQVFSDGQGGVNRAALEQVVQDPEFADQLQAIEEQVRRNRRQAKLAALITATVRVNPAEVRDEFVRQRRRGSAEFVALRYAAVPDDQVEVSDGDLRDYYRDHRDDYERGASYAVEYVAFDKTPTAADSARALDELGQFTSGFRTAGDPAAFARRNSFGAQVEPEYVGAGDMPAELASAVYANPTEGRVVGPLVAGDRAIVARITGVRDAGEAAVQARHILFPADAADRAREVKGRIESGAVSFEQAARQFSADESNKNRGGDLGWFGRGRMVPEFEAAALAAPVGTVIGPVQTSFGQHLILVEDRASQEVELVEISRPVEADFARVVEQAEDFVINLEEEGLDFTEEAQRQGIAPTPVQVQEENSQIPGLDLGRDFFRFVRGADIGQVSDPFDAGTSFIVARVTDRTDAGPAPFEEVRAQVETALLLERKREIQARALREALSSASSLATLASAVGTTVETASDLSLNGGAIPGYGVEPRAVGAVFGLEPGQRSGVIEGDQAAFVLRTTDLVGATDAELTDPTRTEVTEQLLNRERQRVLQAWLLGLREDAEIEDFRNDVL